MKLIEENEPNKYYDVFSNQILDRSLTIDDLKTPKNDDKSSTIDEDKSLKNEEKLFKPDEEILIENDDKSSTIDEDKSNDKLALKIDKLKEESFKLLHKISIINDKIKYDMPEYKLALNRLENESFKLTHKIIGLNPRHESCNYLILDSELQINSLRMRFHELKNDLEHQQKELDKRNDKYKKLIELADYEINRSKKLNEDKLALKIDKLKEESNKDVEKSSTIDEDKSKDKLDIDDVKTETELENTNFKPESIPETPVKTIISTPPDLSAKEQELFKNIELALSYKNNKEYQDNNALEFESKSGKIYKPEKPYKKFKALIHQKIADYLEELHFKYGHKSSEFRKLKQDIIDKINEKYFGENNECGFRVYNKDADNKSFEIKDLKDSKLKRRADKNYVNQNTPNKYVFFKYSMKDIYDIIEEYFEINLSVHSKSLIESIVSSSIDKYIDNANKLGQISYNTIAHGIKNDVIKLIEKYINSKRNIHIKMKFEFDSDSRIKLMEIINKEIDRNKNDFKQKSKNIISFIDHLKFF